MSSAAGLYHGASARWFPHPLKTDTLNCRRSGKTIDLHQPPETPIHCPCAMTVKDEFRLVTPGGQIGNPSAMLDCPTLLGCCGFYAFKQFLCGAEGNKPRSMRSSNKRGGSNVGCLQAGANPRLGARHRAQGNGSRKYLRVPERTRVIGDI